MVRYNLISKVLLTLIAILLFVPFLSSSTLSAADSKQRIYDFANLLTDKEIAELEALAEQQSIKRETDFIILTSKDADGKDITKYMEDFYDEHALGYDKPHGNTAILVLNMKKRDVETGGFYKAEKYIDNSRFEQIRQQITPDLSNGDYYDAFTSFIKISAKYMGIRPGVNPENIFFQWWFQIVAGLGIAGIVVGSMLYNSGGKVTVNQRTYMDANNSRVLQQRDVYVRTTVTKRRKPSNNSGGRSGGGGGITGGGHSYSGSRGKF